MLGPARKRALSQGKRAAFLHKDREGVASTIGTIMALLVFLAFMTLITNSYVPAWMQDNERSHMNEVIDQFGSLKGKVDSMIVEQQVTGSGSIKMYAPITLGSDGVPLFATPTIGVLSYTPQGQESGIHTTFKYVTSTGSTNSMDVFGGGKTELYVPNRYYVPQSICYENGAIIVNQDDGQTVRAYPSIDIEKVSGSNKVNIEFTQIDLMGSNTSMSGSDSVGLNIDLIYFDSQTYTVGGDGTWTLSLNTTYGEAWHRFFNETMLDSGLVKGIDYTLTRTPGDVSQIILKIWNVGTLYYDRAFVSIDMLTS